MTDWQVTTKHANSHSTLNYFVEVADVAVLVSIQTKQTIGSVVLIGHKSVLHCPSFLTCV